MNKSNIVDKRTVKLEEVLREDYIPFLGGRPQRPMVIQRDDILNLRIILNTATSVEDFLKNT